uniref:CobQ/CobB/MinD/ParA nucleotide binding domain-containing protein n=1 Tax=Solibacter usitatus (strain Ellin6076) TaxID=234267 RepID=Q01ZE4_SOLUE
MSTATVTDKKIANEKPRLILTHGEKGGVGKTTVARVIADFLNARDHGFRAFDAEGSTGQLLRFHPDVTAAVDVENANTIAPVLDYVMEGTGKRLALVDLGARSGEDVKGWLYRGGALEEAEAARLGITVIYVLGGAVDSVGHLKECFGALGRDVNYVIVKNFGVAGKFDVYDNSKVRKELLAIGAREINFPALDGSVYQSVDRASIGFSAFADGQTGNFGFTERRYCRTWLRECFAQLETVASALQ